MVDIFKNAQELREGADDIRNILGLERILTENCTQVFYTGSYYLDVMAWSDLDISIVLKDDYKSAKRFMDITAQIAELDGVKKINYRNYLDNLTDTRLPRGLYDGVYLDFNNNNWKIDIWAVDQQRLIRNRNEMDRINQQLSKEKKELVLRVKNSIITDEGRTPPFSGYNIYTAIIDKNIMSVDGIIEYLKEIEIM